METKIITASALATLTLIGLVSVWVTLAPDPHGEKYAVLGLLAIGAFGIGEWWRRSIKPTSMIRTGLRIIRESKGGRA